MTKECTVTFNAKNNLGIQFRLTMNFEVPIHIYNYTASNYIYVNDTDIRIAIDRYCKQKGLIWWLDGPPSGEIGGPYWTDICNIPVQSAIDY